ncbi:MAG: hypothetical protein QOG72_672 [Sphingomonadales bacterium]|jgi:hypothetical protein|nr:hypothetical protein [Sphingomonadales bacterium]
MNKIIIALAATTAFAGAAPAAAQYAGGGYGQIRSDQLQVQLQAGIRSGAISRAEAMPLREQLMQLTRLERLYARDGISGRERADLQHRINDLRQGIRFAERSGGRYDRDDNYGRTTGDGYGRDGAYDRNNDGWDDRDSDRDGRWDVDSRNDSNRDGWDDRDTDRDGRWDDDDRAGYGRGQVDDRGVVGQIVDQVTGTGGLRVGQRASADLGGVPYAYRSQYRDGNGVYYRSDGRRIYQIDARTQAVVRIYAMNR